MVAAPAANADSILSMNYMFGGRNVYAPTVLYDNGVYKMWYGGWQSDSDYPNDKIYYRTSTDNINWLAPATVLRPADVSPNAYHVNDPTVTKHFNTATSAYQYTMFFTVCMNPCADDAAELWSVVSDDGINWAYPQTLLSGYPGPAEPSAVTDISGQRFWKVYYADRADCHYVRSVDVDANRVAIYGTVANVLAVPTNCVTGPEVKRIGSQWHLFFNAWYANHTDIWKAVSSTNTSWSDPSILITNNGSTFCATMTPGILPETPTTYDLYFGLTPFTSSATCDVSQQKTIQRWLWQTG